MTLTTGQRPMETPNSPVLALLSKMAIFKGLDNLQLAEIAGMFTPRRLQAGQVLFEQGERGDCFCIISAGKLKVRRAAGGKRRDLALLETGDYVGEEALLYGRTRTASVMAETDSQVLSLDRQDFFRLLKKYPQIKLYLQATVKTRRLIRRKPLTWLGDEEVVYLMAQEHPATLVVSLILPGVVVLIALVLLVLGATAGLSSLVLILNWAGWGGLIVAALWAVWQYVDWSNDYYVVTNQRVVYLEKVVAIYDSRQEAPLSTVLTVDVHSDQIGRMLGYGDVIVRTYTGQIRIESVAFPNQLAGLVKELLDRSKQVARNAETAALEQAIRARLGPKEEQPASTPAAAPPAANIPAKKNRRLRQHSNPLKDFLADFFMVRFEEGGVVTFRKHWILLVYRIWLPTLLIAGLVAAIILRLMGMYVFLSTGGMLLVGITFLLIVLAWWLYRYIDWRNDIYQVTKDQIIDIYRKPLGREDKKTAMLENILSLEHTRRGILGLLLNYGDVVAMVGTAAFTFDGVYNPAGVEQEVFHRINLRKRAQKDAEVAQERERIADWLAAYHRESEVLRRGQDQNPTKFDQNTGNE